MDPNKVVQVGKKRQDVHMATTSQCGLFALISNRQT
ncbi:ORF165 [Staphylococcus phage EW]|uniref:ORF165 n=1 Tax=Staphylococcus phage EW TaxID=2936814 RepID=Q4ZC43_9CAUD|nr:ORF165 [Staphylococcus phage EW]AAX91414.1 ORF165 [Staphylococcus phage EW]